MSLSIKNRDNTAIYSEKIRKDFAEFQRKRKYLIESIMVKNSESILECENMNNNTELIVMLTYNDRTITDAYEIFDECKDSKAQIWGFKEEGISFDEMKDLYLYMKECGKLTALEVVAYTEEEGLQGANMAYECGCDFLMGTMFFDSINEFCKEKGIKYMPYVGTVYDRPSILSGAIEDMIDEANRYIQKGAYGIDLLGYRYVGDASELINKFVEKVKAPVCVAGSVNCFERLDELKKASPWGFTIGSAFKDNGFNGTYKEQINKVCDYMRLGAEDAKKVLSI